MSKKNPMMAMLPTIDLKGEDFAKQVPDDQKLEIVIVWKGGNRPNEIYNPVYAFAKLEGKFKIINSTAKDIVYVHDVSDIQRIHLIPTEILNELD